MFYGGAEGIDLEPASADFLLQTLEDWSEVLKHDQELTHTLEAFQKASSNHADNNGVDDADLPAPQIWEPSP